MRALWLKEQLYFLNDHPSCVVLMSTRVEDIDPIVPVWRIVFILLLIPSLVIVAIYLWKHRKYSILLIVMCRVYDPTLEMFSHLFFEWWIRVNEEDFERLQLLKNVAVFSPTKENTDDGDLDTTHVIQCERCGFVNSSKSTVCRECNALLKGNAFFTTSKQTRYY